MQVLESTVDACKVVEACLTCTDLRFQMVVVMSVTIILICNMHNMLMVMDHQVMVMVVRACHTSWWWPSWWWCCWWWWWCYVSISHYIFYPTSVRHLYITYDKHLKFPSEQFASMTKHSESLRWLHPFSSQTCIRFKTLRIPWATSTLCLDLVWTSAQKPRIISPVGGPCSWSGMANADSWYWWWLFTYIQLLEKKR